MLRSTILAMALGSAVVAAPALAQETGETDSETGAPIRVELNKLETAGEACRVYLMFENEGERGFGSLKLDLVTFDPDGIVGRRLAVEAGPLAGEKTSVKLFDLNELDCGDISRVLVNDVTACADADGQAVEGCLARLETASRAETPLVK